MKNKIVTTLTACLLIIISIFSLTACNEGHKHNFTIEAVDQAYLASEATCDQAAKYYYSCECGEKGSDTFTVGDPHHSYDMNNVCKHCSEKEIFTPGLDIRLSSDGSYARVFGVGSAGDVKNIVIPSSYQEKPVTEIVTQAFKSCSARSITLPWTVTKIGISAFQECKNLYQFTVTENVTYIGSMAFDNSGLTNLYFKDVNGWVRGKGSTADSAGTVLDPETLKNGRDAASAFKSKSGVQYNNFKK